MTRSSVAEVAVWGRHPTVRLFLFAFQEQASLVYPGYCRGVLSWPILKSITIEHALWCEENSPRSGQTPVPARFQSLFRGVIGKSFKRRWRAMAASSANTRPKSLL